MSETVYTDIRAALIAHLVEMPGLPAVAWENSAFVPVADEPYLEPNVIWAETEQAEIGTEGANREAGIFQIRCVYPANEGIGPQSAMMGKIREHFKRGTTLEYNGITVRVRKAYPSPNGIISIAFYCQVPN